MFVKVVKKDNSEAIFFGQFIRVITTKKPVTESVDRIFNYYAKGASKLVFVVGVNPEEEKELISVDTSNYDVYLLNDRGLTIEKLK